MCGITGWVDFARDLTLERDTVQTMTTSMGCRGPDDEGIWLTPHVAFGHRRLAVIDVQDGRQPMIAENDTVITYSGETYNFRELRGELASAGHSFRTRSDTEVVLRAYLQWGVDIVRRLNGMYAFAIWDGAAEELILIRDRLGVKPLYYYRLPEGILFGSEPKAILANPLAKSKLNSAGMRALLTGARIPGEVPFVGMRELQPGHYLRVSRVGMSERRYWGLEAHAHVDDTATTVATVRELLEDIVSRQLISDVPLCTLLSGGLDSSVITALAQRAISRSAPNECLRTFAVDFSGYTDNFEADSLRETPDGPYVHDVVRHVGSSHQDIVLNTEDLFAAESRRSVVRAWDLPFGFTGDMDISLYLLFEAIRERSTVAISGEGADELFGGYAWMHDPAALELPIFPWMAPPLRDGAPAPFSLFKWDLIERLQLIEYLRDLYSDSLAGVPRLPGESKQERRMREVIYLHLTRHLPTLLDRKDRMSMAVGLEVRVPFCDHRLVEYVFNTPWSMKTFDGREKSLLRQAALDLLPTRVLQRRKAIFPSTQDPRYDRILRGELSRMLAANEDPVLPFLALEATRGVAGEPVRNAPTLWERVRVENVIRMNMWLKEYRVDVTDI